MKSIKPGILIGLGVVFAILGCVAIGVSFLLGYNQGWRGATLNRQSQSPAPSMVDHFTAGLSRQDIIQMLPGKTWFMHWENATRGSPLNITVDNEDVIHSPIEGTTLKPELRWVLTDGTHFLIPLDEYTIKGFYIPTGRPKGYFADRPKPAG